MSEEKKTKKNGEVDLPTSWPGFIGLLVVKFVELFARVLAVGMSWKFVVLGSITVLAYAANAFVVR
ncbi:MAG: hypothetical protein V3V10_03215, partial [Planctomycetota bacterium]